MTNKCPDDFSILDPAVSSNPFDFYDVLREQCPVYQIPETGTYVITKYKDLRQVLKDYGSFTSDVRIADRGPFADLQQSILREGGGWEHVQTLQRTDPPEHSRYRKLLDRVFTIQRVREMAPYMDQVVNDLIDGFIDSGKCEFSDDFAMRMPGIIIAEQLGLKREEVSIFKKWADAMLGASRSPIATEEEIRRDAKIELEAQKFIAEIFEDRKSNPRDDLMSAMVNSQGSREEPLTMNELQNLMHQLITGGFETTQSAINHGMWALIRMPDVAAKLQADISLLKPFVEEVLRWESPVQFLMRQATRDVEMSGTVIPKGALVMVGYGPANRDEEKFGCPSQFDLERKGVGAHLAFGSGPHFCPGALLARQEMMSAFRLIIQRMANFRLAKPLPNPVHSFSMFFLPMHDFHIQFEKR
jgi:cytochrome P450